MKLVVTGASGLIGSSVLRAAAAAGHQATGIARVASRCDEIGSQVPIVRADILDGPAPLIEAFVEADAVVHTAASFSYHADAESLHDLAVRGTQGVMEAAAEAGVRRVVVTSSSVVFGHSDAPEALAEDAGMADPQDEPPYVAAKIAQDRAALELGERLGLDIVLACPTMTLGPTASALGPSNGLILAYLADRTRTTFRGGCNLADAEDVGAAHVLLAERGEAGAHYLLGSENLLWAEIHREIGRLTGVGGPRGEIGPDLARIAAGAEEVFARLAGRAPLTTRLQAGMLGRYYWYDDSRARALGYAPRPAADALLRTVSWLVASPHVSRELRATINLADEVHRFRYARAA